MRSLVGFALVSVLSSPTVTAYPSLLSSITSDLGVSLFDNTSASDRAAAVKQVFETAWDGYYEYAFPNDELRPVSNGFGNSRYICNEHDASCSTIIDFISDLQERMGGIHARCVIYSHLNGESDHCRPNPCPCTRR